MALCGAIPIAAAGGAHFFASQQQRERAVISLAAGAAALVVAMMGFMPVELAKYQDSPYFAEAALRATPFGKTEIASFDVFQPSLVFYCQRTVELLPDETEAREFLRCPLPVYLCVPAPVWDPPRSRTS